MPTFVLNDESRINSYGFTVLNKGIDLARFKANPVMLDQHWNSTSAVLGKWVNIRTEGSQLLADDAFDAEDEAAIKIKGKVDRGLIKGASMGISYNRANMQANPDGTYTLSKCELYEASIVAIPSNANSLRLYADKTGLLMADADVRLSISNLQPITNHNQHMKNLSLSLVALTALGFTEHLKEGDEGRLSLAIEGLAQKLAAKEKSFTELQAKYDDLSTLEAKAVVDAAVLAGKITPGEHAEYLGIAKQNLALAKKMFDKMQGKTSLAGQVDNPPAPGEVKDLEAFQKLTISEQLAYKAANPEGYKKLCA